MRSGRLHALVALISYVPLLLTRRGQVVADTKQYLYLDPQTMLESSGSLWDPDWALGTVTHQSIGYLWPMAPFFTLTDTLGLPMWAAQRLWLGSILFAAMTGMLFLGRRFAWSPTSQLVAALFYGLSPYALAFSTRLSVLIMPWAGLPWLLGLAMLALERGSDPELSRRHKWRDPARIALITTTIGAVNASSLLYVAVAVVAWFPYATFSANLSSLKDSLATMSRIAIAQILTCAWWIVALAVQGSWGPDVLRFSETLEVVASGSPASEAWRGMGYWILYGGDRTGLWVSAGESYTQQPLLLILTFSISALGLAALLFVRWAHRGFMIGLALCGLLLTIGLYPYEDPSPLGSLVADGAAESTLALALRSSPRAIPLYLLAVGCSLAVGVDALERRRQRLGLQMGAVTIAMVICALPSLWSGGYVGDELARPEDVTPAWQAVADELNADPDGQNERVLILPGADFSAHRWGNTIDHILPGLTDRSVAVRELIPFGSAPAADLLVALDRRAQERLLEPAQIGPIASLLGAGELVIQGDLEFERYRTPRPADFWALITSEAAGLGVAQPFGETGTNIASEAFPLRDEIWLAADPTSAAAPELAVVPVTEAQGILRTKTANAPIVVVGDAESLLELAGASALPTDRLILFDASLSDEEFVAAMQAGATVVITDGNRLRARRWKSIRDNLGLTEMVDGDGLTPDPTDARLDVFGPLDTSFYTVTEQTGVVARASSYGNPISYHAEDRAAGAVDGDPLTSWRTGSFTDAQGEYLVLEWDEPTTATTLNLLQPQTLQPNRTITSAVVTLNDTVTFQLTLEPTTLESPRGQTQSFDLAVLGADPDTGEFFSDPIESLRFEIVETSAGRRAGYGGLSGVGLAEIWLDDAFGPGLETIVTPTSIRNRPIEFEPELVQLLLARERVDVSSSVRDDPELFLRRSLAVPWARTYSLSGTIRLSGRASAEAISEAVSQQGTWRVDATTSAAGPAGMWAGAVLDGDSATRWFPQFGTQVGQALVLRADEQQQVSSLEIDVVQNSDLSSIEAVRVSNEHGDSRLVHLVPSTGQTMLATFETLAGSELRIEIAQTGRSDSIDWYSATPIEQPIGISELRVNGMSNASVLEVAASCRDDLVFVNGQPWPIRFSASASDALDGDGIAFEGCETGDLPAGTIQVTTADRAQGWTVDRLLFASSPTRDTAVPAPQVTLEEPGRSERSVSVGPATEPYWLVLAESYSAGWHAQIDGGQDLGPARLVDGFANGWLIDPATVGQGALVVELTWEPNAVVRFGLWFSALGSLLMLLLALWPAAPVKALAEAGSGHVGFASNLSSPPGLGRFGADVAWCALIALVTRPSFGVAALVCLTLCRRVPRTVKVLEVASVVILLVMGAYVTTLQVRYSAPHDGAWPSLWHRANTLGLLAIIGLWMSLILSPRATRCGEDV